jgi:hypothetical protein
MAPAETSAFDLYREQVESMMQDDETLASVEETLEQADLPKDERSALWLLAWALSRTQAPRRAAAVAGEAPTAPRRRLAMVPIPAGT